MFRSTVHAAALLAAMGLAPASFGQAKPEPKPAPAPAKTPELPPGSGTATGSTLTIGDKAPAIDVEHWIKGDKVASFAEGKVYVVEFWATWCGPCRMSMPHITDLQAHYKNYGVTFIGISDEPLDTVTKFLNTVDKKSQKKWNDVVGYTLTTDPDASVKKAYFTAAGQRGIPCAFIVGKDQHIEWIGHPMDIEKPLESVVKDSWDRTSFKTQWDASQQSERDMATFMNALTTGNDPAKGYEVGERLLKANWESPTMLNQLAWFVVDTEGVKTRNLDFALKAATRANELTHDKEAAILDTLARIQHDKGDLKAAVETQKKAVANAEAGPMAESIKAMLKKYEQELAEKK